MALMQAYSGVFTVALIILALMAILCLVRAVIGPTIADRLVAVNMMGTMVMVIISILAVRMGEGYLVDICLIYAMISFLSVVVLTKVYTGVYLEGKKKEQEAEKKKVPAGDKIQNSAGEGAPADGKEQIDKKEDGEHGNS